MASGTNVPLLAERSDIHRSCKSLETLLNILNEYCEAAGSVVSLQKKLVKALRETAGLKVTGEIAANAMNASATIFDALSDIDAKFSKVADKECDSISAEVKKWFKKLAKEEKAHDERIASANTKIKLAGQAYEKRSKKNPRDASQEHARYINLISSLGPEMSQEKYNHSLQVTQRHASTTYSVAACISQIADAEWLKACEGVRRFSPTIGQLGQWRAMCEGGWTGPVPPDLPDIEKQTHQPEAAELEDERATSPTPKNMDYRDGGTSQAHAEDYVSLQPERRWDTVSSAQPRQAPTFTGGPSHTNVKSTAPSSYEPPRLLTDPNTGSVRSLSAFPAPPTHFPIPPLRQPSLTEQYSQSRTPSTPSNVSFPTLNRLTESPLPGPEEDLNDDDSGGHIPSQGMRTPNISPISPREKSAEKRFEDEISIPASDHRSERELHRPAQRSQSIQPVTDIKVTDSLSISGPASSSPRSRSDYPNEHEPENSFANTHEEARTKRLERNDTDANNGNIVAAMRSRYKNESGSSSPPPKDMPRLPLSVTDLASRYQAVDQPTSPVRLRTSSPTISRRLSSPPLDTAAQAREAESAFAGRNPPMPDRMPGSTAGNASTSSTPDDGAARRHPQTADNLDLKEKERELGERERDINIRARELELDRARLIAARTDVGYVDASPRPPNGPQLGPRERHGSFQHQQRPYSQVEVEPPSRFPTQRPRYSHSTTHLVPPPSSMTRSDASSATGSSQSNTNSQPPSPHPRGSPRHSQEVLDHAPYCGCDKCSISKYKSSPITPSAADLRPPEKPITLRPEKPKGWIRRLSMPVGNAFSLDSKRSTGGGLFSLDGKKNASSTALRSVQEDGRMTSSSNGGRISYEAGAGISNRSVASLALGGRR